MKSKFFSVLFVVISGVFTISSAWADAACDGKAQKAATAKWSSVASTAQVTVTGTQIVAQSTSGTSWTKTVVISMQSQANALGSVRITSSGATASACTVGTPTLETAQNLLHFPKNEVIAKIESMVANDNNLGSDLSTACAITYGIKKFLPHEYSQAAALQTKPNFFYVGVQGQSFHDTNNHYFMFDVANSNYAIALRDYSPTHLYAQVINLASSSDMGTMLEISQRDPSTTSITIVNSTVSSNPESCTLTPPPQ